MKEYLQEGFNCVTHHIIKREDQHMGTLLIFLGVFGILAYEKIQRYNVKKHIRQQDAFRAWMLEDREDGV